MTTYDEIISKWFKLGDDSYQKIHLYDLPLSGQLDLSEFKIASALYGGHIALFYDSRTDMSGQSSKPLLQIFNPAGKLIWKQLWMDASVIGIGWTLSEDLLLVQITGKVAVIDLMGNYKRTFSMGNDAEDQGVIDCRFFITEHGGGLAVLTSRHKIFLINSITDPRIRRLPDIPNGLTRPPSSWICYNNQVLLARDNQLFFIDPNGVKPVQNPPISEPKGSSINAVLSMAVSHNQKLLALFLDTGVLWVGSSDFSKQHCELETDKKGSRPLQMVWCGISSVLLYWHDSLLMVGPQRDTYEFAYMNYVHLEQEPDGVRLISAEKHEFLQRVGHDLDEIAYYGESPGVTLFMFYKYLQENSLKLEEQDLDFLNDNILQNAVDNCLDAASQSYEPELQKVMLSAARLGRGFLSDTQYLKSDNFSEICRMLRVLNNVRHPMIAMPLTYKQIQRLGPSALIDRLIARGHYPMAQCVCKHLKLPESETGSNRILDYWACKVVESTRDDKQNEAAKKIESRLGTRPGISYAKIASRAHEKGKDTLASELLKHECRISEQIPLLLKLGHHPRAIEKAVDSCDPELIQFTIDVMRSTISPSDLMLILRKHPTALAIYQSNLENEGNEGKKLSDQIAQQEDNRSLQGAVALKQSFDKDSFDHRVSGLEESVRLYKESGNEFMAQEVDNSLRLLRYQRRLEEEFHQDFVGLSLHRTLYQLILRQNTKLVEKMKSEFKVPDKRFWFLKLEALAQKGLWEDIAKMSKEKKKPPIQFEAFLDVCIKHEQNSEAVKYLHKLEPESRVKYLYKLDRIDEAIDTAYNLKSEEALGYLYQHLLRKNRPAADRVNAMLTQIR